MDFTFSEEQQAAAEAAGAVFSGVDPGAVPSPALTRGPVAEGCDERLWRRLADADLLGLVLDPAYGGAGLDPVALCLVLREAGRVLARVPLLETCAVALAVQRFGDGAPRAELLPKVADGSLRLTAASAGRTGHDGAELAVTARKGGEGHWVLDGAQTAVPWVRGAALVAVPADEGLFLVDPGADGVTARRQVSTSGEELAHLEFDGARVPAALAVTAPGAWAWLRALLTTGTCALALGLGERVLRMTADYVGRREQFGHPLATFQAVACQAADRYIDLRAMEATLWQAAWRLGRGGGDGGDGDGGPGAGERGEDGVPPVAADVAVAKIWAAEGVRRVVQTAQHLHGGFGADTDYALHRYHAWAKHLELYLGPPAAHEEELGELLAAHAPG
ncbi:acyl-CoA dehydrogenase family protein [Streptomyces capparidis]